MLRASLTQKIVLPLGAVVLLLQIGLGAYALDHERETLLHQLDTRAARLANICHAFDLHGEEIDERQVAQWLGKTLLEQEDVVFCEVIATEDRTLFREGTLDEQQSRRYSFPITGHTRPFRGSEATPAEALSQAESVSGTLYLALSTVDVEQALTEARGTLAVSILAGTAFAMLIATLLVRHTIGSTVTGILRNLQIASARHLGYSTSSQSRDELQQLAEMLNAQRDQLKDVVKREQRLTAQMISEHSQHEETAQ